MADVQESALLPSVAPDARAPDDLQRIDASSNAFGATIAQGEKALGQGATDASGNIFNTAQFYSNVAATQAVNNFYSQSNKILHGDPSKQVAGPDGQVIPDMGYFGLKGAAAMTARPQVLQQLDDYAKEQRAGLTTLESQHQFDNDIKRQRFYIDADVGTHADREQTTWAKSVNDSTAELSLNEFSQNPTDPRAKAKALEGVIGSYVKNAQLSGEDPRGAVLKAQQAVAVTQYRSLLPTDPVAAQKTLEENRPLIGSIPEYDSMMVQAKAKVMDAQLSPLANQIIDNTRTKATQGGEAPDIKAAIIQQESGGNPKAPPSVNGAIGQGQIKPETFVEYAKPGERIDNPADNARVSGRIIDDYSKRFGGDPAKIAVAYFSGPGNVAPVGSATPYLHDYKDGTGKSVSAYVMDVQGRLGKGGSATNLGDYYRLNEPQILDDARAQAERVQPNNPDFADRVVDRVSRGIHAVITRQDQEYQVSVHTVQRALNGSMTNGILPTNVDDLTRISPEVSNAWNSVLLNNPAAAEGVNRMFDANARGQAADYGTSFYSFLQKALAPNSDPGRISDSASLFKYVEPGGTGPLSNRGVSVLTDIIGNRGTPQGDAQAAQMLSFLKTAHNMISGETTTIADPKGEQKYGEFLKHALPQIAAAQKTGDTSKLYDQKGDLYNSITNFMRPITTQYNDYIYRTDINPADAWEGSVAKMNLSDPATKAKATDSLKAMVAKNPKLLPRAKELAVKYGLARDDGPSVPPPQ